MPLKAMLSKSEVEALAEPLRKEYVERDGQFVLAVEGLPDVKEVAELKTKLGEFRDNNKRLFQEVEALKPLKEKYEGIDPDEYHNLKTEVEGLKKKGINRPEDLSAIIAQEIAKATKPIQDKLAAEEKRAQEANQRMLDQLFEKQITDVALKAGVRQQAIDLIIPKARQKFEIKDETIVPREGVRHPTEPHKDLTPTDWLTELAKTDDYLFAQSSGGDATGGKTRKASAKLLINPTAEEMGRHMDAIAKGEIAVVRQ